MSWQRPNIGSRVTREGHARFWERPEVEFLRATRQTHQSARGATFAPPPSRAGAPDSRGTAKTIQTSAHAIDQGQRDKCGAARPLSRLWSLEPAEAAAVMFSVHTI